MEKHHIIKEKKEKYVMMERDILNSLRHPNVIKLYGTFKDRDNLYFVLELAQGGELYDLIREHGTLCETAATFYAAEILNVLQYLHSKVCASSLF